jgi:hypothetical protein
MGKVITRRFFAGTVLAAAIANSRRPHILPREHVRCLEIRTYRGESQLQENLANVFARNGISVADCRDLTFLIPFDSLELRARAWDRVNCDAGWIAIRKRVRLSELKICRAAQPGGKIFEISL